MLVVDVEVADCDVTVVKVVMVILVVSTGGAKKLCALCLWVLGFCAAVAGICGGGRYLGSLCGGGRNLWCRRVFVRRRQRFAAAASFWL